MKLLSQWAVTSAALILIVLAVRYLFRRKLSARLRYALWAVVLVRLLVPFQVTLPTSVSDFLPLLASNLAPEVADVELYALRTSSRPMPEENLQELWDTGRETGDVLFYETTYLTTIAGHDLESNTHCYVLSDTGIDRYFFYTTLPKFLIALWAIGAAVAAWTIFRSNLYFFGRLKYYRHALEDMDAPIPVYTAANVPSPCLFGVFRPAVYITPEAAENPDTLRHVLAHELTHYKHKDHTWSLLRCLALALHWYNPLVWLAVVLSKRDGELACDEGAIARLGEAERIPYGRTLVDTVAARSARPVDLLSCSTAMTGGTKSIQQRVAQLVKKPETVKAALFAAVSVLVLAVVFVFAVRAQPASMEDTFKKLLDQATGIRVSPPAYSSTFYPDPITDEDLLAAAKERLSAFTEMESDIPQLDMNALFTCSIITLTNGETETKCTLLWQNNFTYLFLDNLWELAFTPNSSQWDSAHLISASGAMRSEGNDHVASGLAILARQQNYRIQNGFTPVTYDYEMFHNRLSVAQAIYHSAYGDNPGRILTDTALLAQARELLVLDRIDRDGPMEWDGSGCLYTLSLASTEPASGWTGGPEYFYVVSKGGKYYIASDNKDGSTGGYYLGAISPEKLDKLEDLFLQEIQSTADRYYQEFLRYAEWAESIQVEAGDAASPDELAPITDSVWLEEARTALLTVDPLPQPDMANPIRLSETELRHSAGSDHYAIRFDPDKWDSCVYYIDHEVTSQGGVSYVVVPLEYTTPEDPEETRLFARVGILQGKASYALWVSAMASNGKIDPPTGNTGIDLSGLTVHHWK